MTWGSFIASGVGAWAKKAAVSLGFGIVTYAGFQGIKDQLSGAVGAMWGGMSGDVYAVVALSGFVDAVGVWMGAITAAVSLLSLKRLGMVQA